MFRKISFKAAVFVNTILFVVITIGTILLVISQFSRIETHYREKGKYLSAVGAMAVSRIFEEAIDNGVFPVHDAFDTDYIPISNFDPPKYHTKYDAYLDKAILTLQDEMLKNKNVVYAVATDKNGYVPTHNSKYQQAISNNTETDRAGNRTKRIFNDPVGLAAAKNAQEGFIQIYKRDTGEEMWDVTSPITVKGKQWGNFRVGISLTALQAEKKALLLQVSIIMIMILSISVAAIIVTVNKILLPLTKLTTVASKMADGDVTQKIEVTTHDEIGDLAEVLERMRISLKAAMDRLTKKTP